VVMDLLFHGRPDLAQVFTQVYFQAAADPDGAALLPWYTAYRAAVRGKVEGMELAEKEVPQVERTAALTRARAHWLLALGQLEEAGRRPCLVLVGGLPGTGKSTLARGLAEQAGFQVIRSDQVRKEHPGPLPEVPQRAGFEQGLYAPAQTALIYAECLRRAEGLLFEGQRVLVDASFRAEDWRRAFLEAAARWGVPAVWFLCQAEPEVVRVRLRDRRDDVSDADWDVYRLLADRWEEPGPFSRPALRTVRTGESRADALAQALAVLREKGLLG